MQFQSGKIACTAILVAGFLMAGCASQGDTGTAHVQKRCPDGKILRCFGRTAGKEECSCVSQGKIEGLFEY